MSPETLGATALACIADESVGDMKCGDLALPAFSSPGQAKGFGIACALRRFVLLALAVISVKVPILGAFRKNWFLLSWFENWDRRTESYWRASCVRSQNTRFGRVEQLPIKDLGIYGMCLAIELDVWCKQNARS